MSWARILMIGILAAQPALANDDSTIDMVLVPGARTTLQGGTALTAGVVAGILATQGMNAKAGHKEVLVDAKDRPWDSRKFFEAATRNMQDGDIFEFKFKVSGSGESLETLVQELDQSVKSWTVREAELRRSARAAAVELETRPSAAAQAHFETATYDYQAALRHLEEAKAEFARSKRVLNTARGIHPSYGAPRFAVMEFKLSYPVGPTAIADQLRTFIINRSEPVMSYDRKKELAAVTGATRQRLPNPARAQRLLRLSGLTGGVAVLVVGWVVYDATH